jgi:AcrR family transcriptional regulator
MGINERKEREKESRRENIVNAAEKIIQVKGFEGMTMDDVAVIAELGKGTIYLYFKNKTDLYHAVVCRGLRLLKNSFEKTIRKKSLGIENLIAIGQAYYNFCHEYPLYFNAMMHQEVLEVEWEKHVEYEGVKCCEEVSNKIFTLMAEVIRAGTTDGSIRPDLHPQKLTILLWAQVTGVLKMTAAKNEIFEKLIGITSQELIQFHFELIRLAISPRSDKGGKP